MSVRLTIKNYRCFVAPAVFEFSPGFTAFVGVNNAGKSALIRFLVEFRNLFQQLREPNYLQASLQTGGGNPFQVQHVFDPDEVFSNLNDGQIEICIEFFPTGSSDAIIPTEIRMVVARNLKPHIKVLRKEGQIVVEGTMSWLPDNVLLLQGAHRVDFGAFVELINVFCNTLYIGPFRNIINVGANTTYFDIQIGDAFVAQFRDLKTGPNKKNSVGIQRL